MDDTYIRNFIFVPSACNISLIRIASVKTVKISIPLWIVKM